MSLVINVKNKNKPSGDRLKRRPFVPVKGTIKDKKMGIVINVYGKGTIDGKINEMHIADIAGIKNVWDDQAFAISKDGYDFEFADSEMNGSNPYEDGVFTPLDRLVEYAKRNNLTVDGAFTISSRWSDYDNITILITNNQLKTGNTEIMNASTEELEQELQKRKNTERAIVIEVKNDDSKACYAYNSITALSAEWLSDDIDMNVPANDAEVISVTEGRKIITGEIVSQNGKTVTFEDVLIYYGIVQKEQSDSPKDPYFEIVLLEKPGSRGLTRSETTDLHDMLSMNEAFPIEIGDINGNSTAMGFITPDAAEKLQYEYGQESDLGQFVASILDDMGKESEDGTYVFKDLRIWLNREGA